MVRSEENAVNKGDYLKEPYAASTSMIPNLHIGKALDMLNELFLSWLDKFLIKICTEQWPVLTSKVVTNHQLWVI